MGGTPHIPIEVIWSDVQTRVGTPHKILRCLRSRGGGTPHIPIEVRVGTPHKVLEQFGWGHRTALKGKMEPRSGYISCKKPPTQPPTT